jgi:hypothetical protein
MTWYVKYMEDGRLAGQVVLEEVFPSGKAQVIAAICGGWLKTYKSALISEEQSKQMWKTWKKYGA